MKKILTIILIFILIIAAGIAIFFFFDRQENGISGAPGGGFNIGDYFPFGRGSGSQEFPQNGSGVGAPSEAEEQGEEFALPPPQLWQISEKPQSGAVVFKTGSGTFVRYLDRATGNVFESKLTELGRRRISNTTIPKVYEALWFSKGDAVILRYTSDAGEMIKSLYAKIISPAGATSTASGQNGNGETLAELQGTFLSGDISSMAVGPAASGVQKIFYIAPNSAGGTSGFIAEQDGSKRSEIFSSLLREWLVSWPKTDTIALATKPSGGIPGYFYFLNSKSGAMTKVLGPVSGLTALAKPDAAQVLYSSSGNSGLSLFLYDVKSGESRPLSQKTLPEKCAWSAASAQTIYCALPKAIPSAKYPDTWYQGLITFNDAIWKINASSSVAEILIDPLSAAGEEIDAVGLALDQDENYLIFTNKKDLKLWGLRLF